MKKTIKILWMAMTIFSIISCEDWLDVNASTELDRNELFKTEDGYGGGPDWRVRWDV